MNAVEPCTQTNAPNGLAVSWLGLSDYEPLWRRMQAYTDERNPHSVDRLWLTEHPSVFTLGLAAKREHLLNPGPIPVVKIDRGGEVTYHGPGQLLIYPLIDLNRSKLGVRKLVTALEEATIALCDSHGIAASTRAQAPGVYVAGKKLASVGLRIRRGASYHGMALNVAMDLEPFGRINPCGYAGLEMTDLRRLGYETTVEAAGREIAGLLADRLKPTRRVTVTTDADGIPFDRCEWA